MPPDRSLRASHSFAGWRRNFRASSSATCANKKDLAFKQSPFCLPQRLPTFPGSCPPSIIGTTELNYCVRYGYRCDLRVIVTEFLNTIYSSSIFSTINSPILWTSPRPISIGQLHTLLHFHLRPINHVVYMGSY